MVLLAVEKPKNGSSGSSATEERSMTYLFFQWPPPWPKSIYSYLMLEVIKVSSLKTWLVYGPIRIGISFMETKNYTKHPRKKVWRTHLIVLNCLGRDELRRVNSLRYKHSCIAPCFGISYKTEYQIHIFHSTLLCNCTNDQNLS